MAISELLMNIVATRVSKIIYLTPGNGNSPHTTPNCTFTDLSNRSTSEGGSVASINAPGGGVSGLEFQPDVGSTVRLNPTATIHQAQASSLGRLPEINEENTTEESYIPTTASRSRGPEHHVPTNSYHDRRGRSPPELSFTTATRVFDAIREHTARSILSLSHPGFFPSRSMFTDRSERGRLPSTSQESSRILAGTNTSQAARSPRRAPLLLGAASSL